jgi:hypothetical protein
MNLFAISADDAFVAQGKESKADSVQVHRLLADFKGCTLLGQDSNGGMAMDQVEFSRFNGEAKSSFVGDH